MVSMARASRRQGHRGQQPFAAKIRSRIPQWVAATVSACSLWAGPAAAHDPLARSDIRVGAREDAYPFSFRNPQGLPDGYSVELCRLLITRIGKNLGRAPYAIKIENLTSRTRIAKLLAGDIDIECGSTSNTPARRRAGVCFSPIIFESEVAALVRRDLGAGAGAGKRLSWSSEISHLKSGDPAVVTTKGSTSNAYLRTMLKRGAGFTLRFGEDHGEAGVFVMDRALLAPRKLEAEARGQHFDILDGPIVKEAVEYYGLMMRQRDVALRRAVESAFKELQDDAQGNQLIQLHEKWFSRSIPPSPALSKLKVGQPVFNIKHPKTLGKRLEDEGQSPGDRCDPQELK